LRFDDKIGISLITFNIGAMLKTQTNL
jgi:hypothetical protein